MKDMKSETQREKAKRKLQEYINGLKAMRIQREKREKEEAYWNQPLDTKDRD